MVENTSKDSTLPERTIEENGDMGSSLTRKLDTQGLTLVEVAIAVAIIALFIPVYLYLQQGSFYQSNKTKAVYEATSIIEQEIENIKYLVHTDSLFPGDTAFTKNSITIAIDTSSVMDKSSPPKPVKHALRYTVTARWTLGAKSDSLVVPTIISRAY